MEVVAQSKLPVASQLWQSGPGSWVITFIAKATFDLQPERAQLSTNQEPIHEHDRHFNDDPTRSVYAPSDLAPLKNRVDVVLVGSAYAPKGQAVRSLFARLAVGEIDKSIEVYADRFVAPDGSLIEGPRFTRMSLEYERAAGGPATTNPIGVRFDVRDGLGRVKLPNLQAPGLAIHSPGTTIGPIGFGPFAETWPVRAHRLGRYASTWSTRSFGKTPVPEDLDRAFFNAAPPDQQLADVAEDVRIVMEHLHPEWPRLITTLPGIRPRAVLDGRGGLYPLKMRADTLWIDSDRGIACLTFRSHRTLSRYDEPGRILISLEEPATSTPPAPVSRDVTIGLPFTPAPPTAGFTAQDERAASSGGVPFVQPTVSRPPPVPAHPPPARPTPPPWPVPAANPSRPAVPAVAPTFNTAFASTLLAPPVPSSALPLPAPAVITPPSPSRPAPTGATNSAARTSLRLDANEMLHLIWFDTASVARICKIPVWRAILDEFDQKRSEEDPEDEPVSDRDPVEIENTRDITRILTQAASEDIVGVIDELTAAVRPGNKYVPALLLLSGDLSFPFDERETLRAAIAVASPLATTDEAFKNAVKEAKEFLASGVERSCPPAWIEGYTQRIRETFQRSRRTVPVDTLDLQMERLLLDGRHYQKRQVFGMNAIRAFLHTATGQSNVKPAPVYIPQDMAKKLPLYQRFRARIIVELYFQEDQHESHPAALKTLAMARIQQVPEQKK